MSTNDPSFCRLTTGMNWDTSAGILRRCGRDLCTTWTDCRPSPGGPRKRPATQTWSRYYFCDSLSLYLCLSFSACLCLSEMFVSVKVYMYLVYNAGYIKDPLSV